ncbi:MAG: hypothetical protein LUD22_02320 [Coprobacillus sp.]|nr:hypothetical protein [Coprobacillus sp.]
MGLPKSESKNKLEYGDYQTPRDFCHIVISLIAKEYDPSYVFEPTFGLGNFLDSCRETFKNVATFYGNEINEEYFEKYSANRYTDTVLYNEDIFTFDNRNIINAIGDKPLLIIGNPPWATNTKLSIAKSKNLPDKRNEDNLKGIDALTGKSNFDISESIITALLKGYEKCNVLFAFLCKTQVATNIMKKINEYKLRDIKIYKFSARKVFGVDVDACLFTAKSSNGPKQVASVYDLDNPAKELYKMGYKENKFYTKIDSSIKDGRFFMEWHSGVKHDLKKIMELEKINDGLYRNGNGEQIELEEDYIYPLLKSSDLKNNRINNQEKYVIITQKHTNENTANIKQTAPKLWTYLKNNEQYFKQRKSKIYSNKPPFSIFGVGPYCFKKYKVAVSSFYKNPAFIFVSSNKPTFFDDTCYFISFDHEDEAIITCTLLNSEECKKMLDSIGSKGSKRFLNKEILMRIDPANIIECYDYERFKKECQALTLKKISKETFDKYKQTILDYQYQDENQTH